MSCGKHRCVVACCDAQQHECNRICNGLLNCRQHRCDRVCHTGSCNMCHEASKLYSINKICLCNYLCVYIERFVYYLCHDCFCFISTRNCISRI